MKKLEKLFVLFLSIGISCLCFSFQAVAQGNAFDVPGGPFANAYIAASNMPNVNKDTWTMEVWVNQDQNASFAGIITDRRNTCSFFNGFWIDQGQVRYSWLGLYWEWNSGVTVNNGEWTHIAVVIHPDKAEIYKNGILSATNNVTHLPSNFSSVDVGSDTQLCGGFTFDGKMDEVRLWDIALTETDIGNLYHQSFSNPTTPSDCLLFYYKADDSAAGTATDYSGNGRHGTFTGSGTISYQSSAAAVTSGTAPTCATLQMGPPTIPTMGEWALIIFGLIVLSFGVVSVMRWQKEREIQVTT